MGKTEARGIILKWLVCNTLIKDRSPLKMKIKWKEMKKEGKSRMSIASIGKTGLLDGEKSNWFLAAHYTKVDSKWFKDKRMVKIWNQMLIIWEK